MTAVEAGCTQCTVVVTFSAAPERLREIETHARVGVELMHGMDGFGSGVVHRATEDGRVVQLTRWRSGDDYSAFVEGPLWAGMPSARRLARLAETGELTVELQTFDILHTTAS